MLMSPAVHIGRGVQGEHDILIAPDDTAVSRDHATIFQLNGRWNLEDTSRNGTLVNNELIKQREVPLKLGDRVQIGRTFDYTFFDIAVTVEARMDTLSARSFAPLSEAAAPIPAELIDNTPSKEGLWISPSAVIWRNGNALPATLSRTEYRLIKFLASHPGEVCDYDAVVKAVWGDTRSKASLHELIFRVRRKLEGDAALPRHLIIRSGIGVVFFPKGEPLPIEA